MIDFQEMMSRAGAGGNPRKMLGIVIAASVVLLVLWLLMVSRMEYRPASEPDRATQERRDSVRVMMGKTEPVHTAEEPSSRIFMNALTTFIILMIILAGVWYWSRKKQTVSPAGQLFKERGQQTVGPGHQIKILEINEEVWVMGISPDAITLLHRYPKEEWKEPEPPKAGEDRRFYDMFSGKS